MNRHWIRSLLIGSMRGLGGYAAGIAAGAIGMVVRGSQGQPLGGGHLGSAAAAQTCSSHAAQYSVVHIIDVEQRPNRMVVWGA